MDDHEWMDREMDIALDAALQEHIPGEIMVRWTEETLTEMGLPWPARPEDIPEEVSFRVRQRMFLHVADRVSEPLASTLRGVHRCNAERGRIVLSDEEGD